MTRTGEEVKAKYEKQWTRAPARVSLYKTPCFTDLPPFSGLLETACSGGHIHTCGVPLYVRLRGHRSHS